MTTVKVKLKRLRIAPQKVRLVANAVRGAKADDARAQLSAMEKRAAQPMKKLLESALANAQHNFGLDPHNLFIDTVHVDEGMTLKRWLPRAHGRATKLFKRTSHITMTLSEIHEGKNRVEPLQKARMAKTEKKAPTSAANAEEVHDEEQKKPTVQQSQKTLTNKKATTSSAKTQKMFRRKSS